MRALRAIALCVAAAVGAGCLSTTHRIPNRALAELAAKPPEQRSAKVRVVQSFAGDEPPAAQRVDDGTPVVYVGVGGHSHGHGHHGSVRGGSHGVGGGEARAAARDSKGWIIIAALAAVGFAVTEGARYDGWVALHPMHPVHLYGPGGEYAVMPLAQVDPETAAWARRAYVRPSEGPWRTLGRAPLDRAGWTYSVLMGGGEIHAGDRTVEAGFLSHIQFGLFPAQQVGLQFDIALGWRENTDMDTTFDARYALELDLMPFSAGSLHAGGYGQYGIFTHLDDVPTGRDSSGTFYGGGVLLQLELTTRLTITGRAGVNVIYGDRLTEATIGLSIY